METPPARVGKVNSSTLCAEQPRESQDRPTERRGYTEPLRNLDDSAQLGRNLELPPGLDVREPCADGARSDDGRGAGPGVILHD